MHDYPHMGDTAFPDAASVDVYRYRNDFDYTRWQPDTVLKLCNVPWDADYSNVVKFESDAARDDWFARLGGESVTLTSEFRRYPDASVRLPVPFATLSKYNYIWCEYPTMTSARDPVMYADAKNERTRYGFFISDMRYLAPNTTECRLQPDVWTNCINGVHITYMQLEQGHAPMCEVSAADYLQSPITHNEWLLEPESGAQPVQVRSNSSIALNSGDMWACIVTAANPRRDWGTKDGGNWWVPGAAFASNQGVPSYWCFAVAPSVLSLFFENIDAYTPQFKQTVKGVFFAPARLVTLGESFNFGGVICHPIDANPVALQLASLDKQAFGYPARYAGIAKLYTYPHAIIEVTDEVGAVSQIRIENTTGTLNVRAALALAFPWVSVDAMILGSGAESGTSVRFANLTERDFMQWGDWYAHIRKYNVPVFGVIQEPAVTNDYATHYDRAQAATAAQNAYAAAVNAATAAQSNANASAANMVANNALQVAANETMTRNSNRTAGLDVQAGNDLNAAIQSLNASYSRAMQTATAEAAKDTAGVSVAGTILGGAAQGAVAGVELGPAGMAGGAVLGAMQGVLSGCVTAAQTVIGINLEATKTELGIGAAQSQVTSTNSNNLTRTNINASCAYDNMSTQNTCGTAMVANNQSTMNANAARSYNATVANADLARRTAQSAISNGILQAGIGPVSEWGRWTDGENAAQRPMLISCNVLTQSDYEIARAGDGYLRFGYMCNRTWDFTGFNLCEHFTYWRCSDLWLSGGVDSGTLEGWQETIKSILRNGVTVWSRPEDVNEVSIYDNGF